MDCKIDISSVHGLLSRLTGKREYYRNLSRDSRNKQSVYSMYFDIFLHQLWYTNNIINIFNYSFITIVFPNSFLLKNVNCLYFFYRQNIKEIVIFSQILQFSVIIRVHIHFLIHVDNVALVFVCRRFFSLVRIFTS